MEGIFDKAVKRLRAVQSANDWRAFENEFLTDHVTRCQTIHSTEMEHHYNTQKE